MWFLWIPEVKEWLVICNKEDTDYRWSSWGDSRFEAGSTGRLNRDKIVF